MLRLLRALLIHKAPVAALFAGGAAALALGLIPNTLTSATRSLLAWDAAILAYLSVLIGLMQGATPERIAKRAAETDQGRLLVLGASLAAVAAGVIAIAAELGGAADETGGAKALHVGFAFATVALSWVFVNASFASHYAHEFYTPGGDEGLAAKRGGLKFPGDEPPDFWDFLHFALVIGVANQTADIAITSKRLRRIATLHGIAAFVFNTVILALAINAAASLFQ